jgi:DNA-binding transcriptional ArsR family regulator
MTLLNLDMAEVGALIGDPGRANILAALMDGRALTAKELAFVARVTPPTASGHLAKLSDANLLALERRGRFRYYRITSPLVGRMLEAVMAVAAVQLPPRRRLPSRVDDQMRMARTCYDHIAGRLGVAMSDVLVERGQVVFDQDGGEVTNEGTMFLESFGVDLAAAKRKRKFCRPCLDWSERRMHIAGTIGAALYTRCLELGWIEARRDTRALAITAEGARGFAQSFGVALGSK